MLASPPRRRPPPQRFRLAATALLILLACPALARALSLGDIAPLYFDGVGGQGFSQSAVSAQGLVPAYTALPTDDWLAAGAAVLGLPIEIEQNLGTVHQNPSQPSFAAPVIADSTWTVRNDSGRALKRPLLVFTSVDPQDAYPITLPPTGLDSDLLALLHYSFQGSTLLYGAIELPDLAQGAQTQVLVRYVVAGALASGSPLPLPPLGVSVVASYTLVPEPSTGALVGAGLLLVAATARSRRS
jgi:hypothetical protein